MMDPAADLAVQLNHLSGREPYLRVTSELLSRLFPSNLVSRISFDTRDQTSEILSYPHDHPFGRQAKRLIDVYADHPLRVSLLNDSTPDVWRPRRISDVANDLQFYNTRAFQDALRDRGTNRELAITCTSAGPNGYVGWGLGRTDTDFSDREVELATHVQPMLRLLDIAYGGPEPEPEPEPDRSEEFSLTVRENEILRLLGKGLTGTAVGHLLGISPRTVSKHLEHAYAKLGCTNRIDALRLLRGGE